jgi:WhiB family redox-sensing transcriptional regulator
MINGIIIPDDYPDFEEFGPTPCSQLDAELFFPMDFPEDGLKKQASYPNESAAKEVCGSCPYQLRCALYAVKNSELQGIWGGTTERERTSLRRGRGIKTQRMLGLTTTNKR